MLRALTIGAGLLLLFPTISLASPTSVIHQDDPNNCDFLFVPQQVDELGIAPAFTTVPDELIDATDTITSLVACPGDDPLIPNTLVVMTNLTPIAWRDVWYVADPRAPMGAVGTSISNFDGRVASGAVSTPGDAFKIDTVGVNSPLVFESIAFNDIFEPGETWHFIIDDYVNTIGLAASLFDSFGVASASGGGPPSSGSIIAVPVPEPSSIVVAALGFIGLLAFGWRRRKR